MAEVELNIDKPVSIALAAIGGYGGRYVQALLDRAPRDSFRIVAGIDPSPEKCRRLDDLQAMDVPICGSPEEFFATSTADLTVISSPIHFHCDQTCLALDNGSNVLCEKPLGATIQEAERMIEARDAAGKWVGIGYQWSYVPPIQALKRDIMDGTLGKPQRLKSMVLGPRTSKYYGRNTWAAVQRDATGKWILDSPINNATAHYLHNCFYVLGDTRETSARPQSVVGELYRANDIENYDTGAAQTFTEDGVEILYFAAHAVRDTVGPVFCYEFEKATVTLDHSGGDIVARFEDGTTKNYGSPQSDYDRKLWDAMEATADGGSAKPIACPPEAASSQTLCMNGIQESMPEIVEFPEAAINTKGPPDDRLTWVTGLGEVLQECYEQWKLPSELGVEWAKAGEEVDLTDYRFYPGGRED
ncbi:MAG: Gfo/Idh/MocA family protein [Armatimonadota bacterium]